MAINWEILNDKTAGYRSLIEFKSPDGKRTTDLKYAGLRVKLSELEKNLGEDAFFLGIWTDTLVIDSPRFTSKAISIFARSIEIAAEAAEGVSFNAPGAPDPTVALLFTGNTAGNQPWYLKDNGRTPGKNFKYTVPASLEKPQVVTFILDNDGTYTAEADSSYAAFKDLINRPLALNSLKASYAAATELINTGSSESLELAKAMLQWVVTAAGLLGSENNSITGSFAELYVQASATYATINLKAGAYYVPILSGKFYADQAKKLISALETYESDFNTLSTAQNIEKAVSEISASLERVSQAQREPLQQDMDNAVENAISLGKSIQDLRFQWDLNSLIAQDRMAKLYAAIRDANLKRYLKAYVETVINIAKCAYGVSQVAKGSPDAKAGDALKDGAAAVMSIYAVYKALSAEVKPDSLVDAANKLVEGQRSLADSFIASSGIWNELKNNKPITQWPQPSSADAFDQELAWNVYLIEAERLLTNLNGSSLIGDDDYSGDPQEASTNYFAALKVLTEYGKAIGLKMVAYSQLLVTAIKLRSEIEANQKIQANWELLKTRANTDQEKLAALKGILKSRMDAIKRSLFVAWTNYRNSYLYLYFEKPPADTVITLDMNARELKEAFANVSAWVGNLLAPASSKDKIVLPSQDVSITFKFPVIKNGTVVNNGKTQAYLSPAADGKPAAISVNIPRATTQLEKILPDRGMLPIWVRSAQFFLNGVKANEQGRVIVNASTSGTYQNGFPPGRMYTFETQGVEATFAYVAAGKKPYINWDINPAVYMTPSPFTLWTITFDENGGSPENTDEIEIMFNISFLRKPK